MSDGYTIALDEATHNSLGELAKEAGMTGSEYLRKLLLDRAADCLKRQKAEGSLFCVENGGVPPKCQDKRRSHETH